MTTIPGSYVYPQYTNAAPYGPTMPVERMSDIVISDQPFRGGNGNPYGLLFVLGVGFIFTFIL